jgi:hypothetical protein
VNAYQSEYFKGIASWLTGETAINSLGLLLFFAIIFALRGKPRALRQRVALVLGVFALMCFAALRFLP